MARGAASRAVGVNRDDRAAAAHRDDLVLPAEREQDRRRLPGARARRRARASRPPRRRLQPVRAGRGRAVRPRARAASGALRTFRFAFEMRRQDLSSYDVLHAHGEDYWMWRRRVPMHVRTLHGSCFEEACTSRGLREKLRMILLGFTEVLASIVADRTVLISPQTRRWTPWVRTVIPNGVDPRASRPLARRRAPPHRAVRRNVARRKRGAELAPHLRRAGDAGRSPARSCGW